MTAHALPARTVSGRMRMAPGRGNRLELDFGRQDITLQGTARGRILFRFIPLLLVVSAALLVFTSSASAQVPVAPGGVGDAVPSAPPPAAPANDAPAIAPAPVGPMGPVGPVAPVSPVAPPAAPPAAPTAAPTTAPAVGSTATPAPTVAPATTTNTYNTNDYVTICHRTSSSSNPYTKITISINGLSGHLDHGDDLIPAPQYSNGTPRSHRTSRWPSGTARRGSR